MSEGKAVQAGSADGGSPNEALLSLDEGSMQPTRDRPPPSRPATRAASTRQKIDSLSSVAYKIVTHPSVFLSPAVLRSYVKTQTVLRRPQSMPEIFALYATKASPDARSTSHSTNPNQLKNAIAPSLAVAAIDCAISVKDLPLALAIIDTTFCSTAFRRSKVLYRAAPVLAGMALAPLAAYTVAGQLSSLQDSMDAQMATNIAFAGILAYVGFTATIGVVAVTTANDQMDRVTWAAGVPLRERWVREEERSAIDTVAGAWGFKEPWRRGDEEGEEWEALREWIGRRGMVLDKVALMEGME